MQPDKKQSSFDLLRGRGNFNPKDPYWYRITVLIILAAVIVAIAWRLPEFHTSNNRLPTLSPKEQLQAGRSP